MFGYWLLGRGVRQGFSLKATRSEWVFCGGLLSLLAVSHYGVHAAYLLPLVALLAFGLFEKAQAHGLGSEGTLAFPDLSLRQLWPLLVFPMASSLAAAYLYTTPIITESFHYVFLTPVVVYCIWRLINSIFAKV